jgi:hypothetical protein
MVTYHSCKTNAIASAKVTNDRIDSKVLAHFLSSDLLPLSFVPSKCIRVHRELLSCRVSIEIGDITSFTSAKQLSSYTRIILPTYVPGSAIFNRHITQQGSKWLR